MLGIFGSVAVPTVILLGAAFILLLVELFIPGFGVPGVLGLVLLGTAVVLQFMFGSATVAVWILAVTLAVLVAGIIVLVRSLDKGRLSKSFLVLNDSVGSEKDAASDRSGLVGLTGVTETALRPAGIARIGNSRVDVVSEGDFLEPGEKITVAAVDGTRVIVKPAEE